MKPEKQTGQEVVLPAGEENEESLPLFPKAPASSGAEDSSTLIGRPTLRSSSKTKQRSRRTSTATVSLSLGSATLFAKGLVYFRPDNVRVFLDGLRDRVKRGGE